MNRRLASTLVVLGLAWALAPAPAVAAASGSKTGPKAEIVLAGRSRAVVSPAIRAALARDGSARALVILDDDGALAAADPAGSRQELAPSLLAGFRAAKERLLARVPDLTRVLDFRTMPVMLVDVGSPAALERVAADPRVAAIVPDRIRRRALAQSLPLIRQPEAEAAGHVGSGTSVAVLDTGVDHTRSAFGSCSSAGAPGCSVLVSRDFATDDGELDDALLHGTNVAGIVVGVAPGAGILALDVFDGNVSTDSVLLDAIDYAIANQAALDVRAINLSIGDESARASQCAGASNPYVAAFGAARAAGIVPVVAAGNAAYDQGSFRSGLSEPACTPGAVSVGAVYDGNVGSISWGSGPDACMDPNTAADRVACFSQAAPYLTLLAPGALSSAAGVTHGGTSQAAPHVAGAVAVFASSSPAASPADIEQALRTSGPLVADPRSGRSFHRLDLPAVIAALSTGAGDSVPTTTIGRLRGSCGRHGRYLLYRADRRVRYRATLTPSEAGAGLAFELEQRAPSQWRALDEHTFAVGGAGSANVSLRRFAPGARYRIRASFEGTDTLEPSRARFSYFRGPPRRGAGCG